MKIRMRRAAVNEDWDINCELLGSIANGREEEGEDLMNGGIFKCDLFLLSLGPSLDLLSPLSLQNCFQSSPLSNDSPLFPSFTNLIN